MVSPIGGLSGLLGGLGAAFGPVGWMAMLANLLPKQGPIPFEDLSKIFQSSPRVASLVPADKQSAGVTQDIWDWFGTSASWANRDTADPAALLRLYAMFGPQVGTGEAPQTPGTPPGEQQGAGAGTGEAPDFSTTVWGGQQGTDWAKVAAAVGIPAGVLGAVFGTTVTGMKDVPYDPSPTGGLTPPEVAFDPTAPVFKTTVPTTIPTDPPMPIPAIGTGAPTLPYDPFGTGYGGPTVPVTPTGIPDPTRTLSMDPFTQLPYDPSPIGGLTPPVYPPIVIPPVVPPTSTPPPKTPSTGSGGGLGGAGGSGGGLPGPNAPVVGGGPTQSLFTLPNTKPKPVPTLLDLLQSLQFGGVRK
jgi:hypothetical protein